MSTNTKSPKSFEDIMKLQRDSNPRNISASRIRRIEYGVEKSNSISLSPNAPNVSGKSETYIDKNSIDTDNINERVDAVKKLKEMKIDVEANILIEEDGDKSSKYVTCKTEDGVKFLIELDDDLVSSSTNSDVTISQPNQTIKNQNPIDSSTINMLRDEYGNYSDSIVIFCDDEMCVFNSKSNNDTEKEILYKVNKDFKNESCPVFKYTMIKENHQQIIEMMKESQYRQREMKKFSFSQTSQELLNKTLSVTNQIQSLNKVGLNRIELLERVIATYIQSKKIYEEELGKNNCLYEDKEFMRRYNVICNEIKTKNQMFDDLLETLLQFEKSQIEIESIQERLQKLDAKVCENFSNSSIEYVSPKNEFQN